MQLIHIDDTWQVSIDGRVTPHPPGLELTLQRRQGGGWLSIGTGSAGSGGTFSFVTRLDKTGLATFRWS